MTQETNNLNENMFSRYENKNRPQIHFSFWYKKTCNLHILHALNIKIGTRKTVKNT